MGGALFRRRRDPAPSPPDVIISRLVCFAIKNGEVERTHMEALNAVPDHCAANPWHPLLSADVEAADLNARSDLCADC